MAEPLEPPKPPEIAVWGKGSRADFPGISDLNPNPLHSPEPKRTARGIIMDFTAASRRGLQRILATIDRNAPAFTMCLTCPGVWSPDRNPMAKRVFLQLLKRMTASRDVLIRRVGLFWKQEIQSRSAVHYHLLLWGVTGETRDYVHAWIGSQWNELVCRGVDAEGKASHLGFHLHSTNFQEVRNMSSYFAKYMGKDEKAVLVGDPIPGRWWGYINSDCIPFASKSVLADPPARFRVICHRIARKLRQKRANAAKHAAILRSVDMMVRDKETGKMVPAFSEFQLQCGRRRGVLRPHIEHFSKLKLGPYQFPGPLNTGAIVLVGEFAPAAAKRILEYAGNAYRDYLTENPF